MPPVLPPAEQRFENQIRWLMMMVRKLAMQQSATYAKPGVTGSRPSTYTPGVNTPVMNVGQIPVSVQTQSRRYGMQTVDPQGKQRLMVGEQSDGTHGLWVYNAKTGKAVLKTGELGTTQYGLAVEDPTGHTRAQMGELPNGDYGLAYYSAANDGTYAELFPPKIAFNGGLIQTTSSSYSTGSGSPSVTVTLGASGDAIVIASANIGIDSADDTGFVGLSIDGGTAVQTIWASGGSSTVATSSCLALTLTELHGSALSKGAHTITMQQKGSTTGHTFNFTKSALVVWPI